MKFRDFMEESSFIREDIVGFGNWGIEKERGKGFKEDGAIRSYEVIMMIRSRGWFWEKALSFRG